MEFILDPPIGIPVLLGFTCPIEAPSRRLRLSKAPARLSAPECVFSGCMFALEVGASDCPEKAACMLPYMFWPGANV